MTRFSLLIGSVAAFTFAAAPAFAGAVVVPEPATITIFAVGAAGALVVRTLIRRK